MLDRSNEIVPLTTAVEIIVGKSKRDTRNARKKKKERKRENVYSSQGYYKSPSAIISTASKVQVRKENKKNAR